MNQVPPQDAATERRPPRVLLIADDAAAAALAAELGARCYAVDHSRTGADGLDLAMAGGYDAVVLDRALPGLDGLVVLERLRAEQVRTPVLVLGVAPAGDARAAALKAGADDILVKPVAVAELAARLDALLRGPDAPAPDTMLRAGPVEMDLVLRTARRSGRSLELLPREFRLLEYMLRRPNQVLTRDLLLEDVWHYRFIPQTNLVDVHIGKLRRKLDPPDEAPLIHSIRGVGFSLRIPE